jgi:hypothetical protein
VIRNRQTKLSAGWIVPRPDVRRWTPLDGVPERTGVGRETVTSSKDGSRDLACEFV